ncbi:MAG: SIMPL domain-containing protein [Bacteroidetes bacterium]|nr:SIMPL domain-containing protein [Bacteroidota bacterium]
MKKLFLFVAVLSLAVYSTAQSQGIDTRKFIEVTGSAEMQVPPDELELEIRLQEYDNAGKKVKLDVINAEFMTILKKNKIDTVAIQFNDLYSANWYWWFWWEHREEYYQTKSVNIKLNSSSNILKLVEDLNKKWVQAIRISKSSNSKITQYRKEVKIEAAKAAKTKVAYLLEALNEEAGNVLAVEEVPEVNNEYSYWYRPANLLSNAIVSAPGGESVNAVENVFLIKVRYKIKVKFAIK